MLGYLRKNAVEIALAIAGDERLSCRNRTTLAKERDDLDRLTWRDRASRDR